MIITDGNILELIEKVDKNHSDAIQGQNPNLSIWKAWYNGKTSWHYKKAYRSDGSEYTVEMKSTGIAKLIGEIWASNYANEGTSVEVGKKQQTKQVLKVLNDNKVFGRFNAFAEMFNCLGIGATIVMPTKFEVTSDGVVVKKQGAKTEISFISADRVYPITVYDGECIECAFVKYGTNKVTLQAHILVNGKYVIAEVEGEADKTINAYSFKWNNIKVLKTENEEPLFQIWQPNVKDNKDLENQLSASVYADCIDSFMVLDQMYDSLYKEFKNGAKKRFISAKMQHIDANGNLIDIRDTMDDEEFVIPEDDTDTAHNMVQEFNGALRVGEHNNGIEFVLNFISKKCGLGDGKFSFQGMGRPIQTATGEIMKESEFYRNIKKQENFAREQFKNMLMAIEYINNEFTSNAPLTYERDDIIVEFEDNIIEDTGEQRKRDLQEVQAGLMTIPEFRAKWLNKDIKEAEKEAQEKGLLIPTYLTALQTKAITPKLFVERVYGDTITEEEKQAIIDNMKQQPAIDDIM